VAQPQDAPPAGPRRVVGPFTARQLWAVAGSALFAAVALVVLTRPIAPGSDSLATALPVTTPFLVGDAKEGLRPGDAAPEPSWTAADGTTQVLRDLKGNPVRLADLRGKLVWLNFWASWCPPCQSETPVLRDMQTKYAQAGLVIVGIAVQETTPDDVATYAAKYEITYPIAFDATADVFNLYRVFALPTQVFIGPEGRVLQVVNGPLTDDGASRKIEQWLPSPSGG
jgi:thiol-disulfide isomerase/thioredoxin